VVFRTHRDEPTTWDVENQISFRGESSQGVLGWVGLWTWRVEKIGSDGSRIRRGVRAWQKDLATDCDRLLVTDELKLISKILEVDSGQRRTFLRKDCSSSPKLREAFQQ
jgi:hypothetical protein